MAQRQARISSDIQDKLVIEWLNNADPKKLSPHEAVRLFEVACKVEQPCWATRRSYRSNTLMLPKINHAPNHPTMPSIGALTMAKPGMKPNGTPGMASGMVSMTPDQRGERVDADEMAMAVAFDGRTASHCYNVVAAHFVRSAPYVTRYDRRPRTGWWVMISHQGRLDSTPTYDAEASEATAVLDL